MARTNPLLLVQKSVYVFPSVRSHLETIGGGIHYSTISVDLLGIYTLLGGVPVCENTAVHFIYRNPVVSLQ